MKLLEDIQFFFDECDILTMFRYNLSKKKTFPVINTTKVNNEPLRRSENLKIG